MEVTKQRKFLSLKMNLLEEELSAVSNHVNKILQQGKAWIDGIDEDVEGRKLSYKEISSLIEDTAMLMAEKYAELTESSDHKDQVTKTSEVDKAISSSQVTAEAIQTAAESEALKTAVARIEKMEKEFSKQQADVDSLKDHVHGEINKKLEEVAQKVVKQEKTAKKISKVEQKLQTVEEVKTQYAEKLEAVKQRLKNLEEERENVGNFEAIKQRLDILEEGGTENVGKIEELEQRLESLEETETQSAEKLVSVENKVGDLEKNESHTLEEVAVVKAKLSQIETSATSLSNKVENREESLQTLTTTVEAHSSTLENLTSNRETDDAKLRRVQGKVRVLEKEKNKSLAKVGKQFEDVEFQYKMVCKIVADRLVPLERLRSILNERVKDSEENVQKLFTVIQDVAVLAPRVSHLESQILNPTTGSVVATAALCNVTPVPGQKLSKWICDGCNAGSHFNPNSGLFSAPMDGLYWVGFNMRQMNAGEITVEICKALSFSSRYTACDEELLAIHTVGHDNVDIDFAVIHMRAGDTLYAVVSKVQNKPLVSYCRILIFLVK